MDQTITPTKGEGRLVSLDIMRGIALFGILIMNINGMALPGSGYGNPNAWGGNSGWDLTTWFTVNMFFESTMRTIFSILFGAGAILFMDRLSERLPGNQASEIYMRRNIILILMGAAHAYLLLWFGDILYYYGIGALFIFILRKTPIKNLAIILVCLIAFDMAKNNYYHDKNVEVYDKSQAAKAKKAEGKTLTEEETGHIKAWERKYNRTNTPKKKALEEIEDRHKGWWENVKKFKSRVMSMQSYVMYDFFIWDTLIAMILGLILYRIGALTLRLKTNTYIAMIVIGYGIGIPVRYYFSLEFVASGYSPLANDVLNTFLHPTRIALAMAHIGVISLFIRWNIFKPIQLALAAVGKMALTNYISHSVISMILFTGVGFSMYGQYARHELIYIWAIIVVCQLIISPIWLAYYKFGPLEWLWRWMTYGQKPAFKK